MNKLFTATLFICVSPVFENGKIRMKFQEILEKTEASHQKIQKN